MEIVVIIILTDLVTNLLLSSFCPFLTNQKQELGIQQVGGLVTRISEFALLQSYAEFNRLLRRDFLTCCSC